LHISSLGNFPLIVLSAGQASALPSFSEAENQQIWEALQEFQSELVTLSPTGKQIIVEKSGHMIQHEQPEFVIEAILDLLETVRK